MAAVPASSGLPQKINSSSRESPPPVSTSRIPRRIAASEEAAAGEGLGPKVVGAIEWVATGIAKAADYLELLKAAFYGAQAAASYAIGGIIKGMGWLQTKIADVLGWIWNKLSPLVDLLPEKMANAVRKAGDFFIEANAAGGDLAQQMGDAILDEAGQRLEKANAAYENFATGANSTAMTKFFDDAKAKAQALAEASANAAKKTGDIGDGIDPKKMQEIDALFSDLNVELDQIGMTDLEQRFDAIRRKGLLDPQQLERVKTLLADIDAKTRITDAVESLKTPIDDYRKTMADLQGWLDTGQIKQDQFDKLSAKARADAFGESKLPGLVRAGSAEAQALRYDQSRGVTQSKDYPKQQVDQQKTTNDRLGLIYQYIRQQLSGGEEIQLVGI